MRYKGVSTQSGRCGHTRASSRTATVMRRRAPFVGQAQVQPMSHNPANEKVRENLLISPQWDGDRVCFGPR